MAEIKSYTTRGNITGTCGHRHRTLAAALRCQREHSDACRRQGGYSDREIFAVLADGDEIHVQFEDQDTPYIVVGGREIFI